MATNQVAPGAGPSPEAEPIPSALPLPVAIPPVPARWKLMLAGLMLAYLALFTALEYHRYVNLEMLEANDSAANIQTVWSLAHPPVFTSTVQEYLKPVPHNVLGD